MSCNSLSHPGPEKIEMLKRTDEGPDDRNHIILNANSYDTHEISLNSLLHRDLQYIINFL